MTSQTTSHTQNSPSCPPSAAGSASTTNPNPFDLHNATIWSDQHARVCDWFPHSLEETRRDVKTTTPPDFLPSPRANSITDLKASILTS